MKLTRKKLVILVVVVLALGVIAFLLFSDRSAEQTPSTPTATSTTGLSSADKTLVEQLSKDLGTKFYTYTKPNSPSYFESIKPYLDPTFFQKTVDETKRYGDRLDAPPVQSEITKVEITSSSSDNAIVRITVKEKDLRTEQTSEFRSEIRWEKRDGRWVAVYVLTSKSEQNQSRYLETPHG